MALNNEVQSFVENGYTDLRKMLFDIAEWLSTAGWNIEYQFPKEFDKIGEFDDYSCLLTPRGDSVNLFNEEPIAIKLSANIQQHKDGYSYQTIEAQVTSDLQCDKDSGVVIADSRGVVSGNLGPKDDYIYNDLNGPVRIYSGDGTFFDTQVVKGRLRAHPVSCRVSVTSHGVFLATWLEGDEQRDPPTQSWFLVQRPVDQSDGEPLRESDRDGSRNPIFCMYGISNEVNSRQGQHQTDYLAYAKEHGVPVSFDGSSDATRQGAISLKRFVVREKDVNAPSLQSDAWRNDRDANAIINLRQQQARIEMRDIGAASVDKAGSRYAILFPSKLNTARFRFKHELDMVAYTSADVISSGLPVNVHVYNEKDEDTGEKLYRRYVAIQPTGPFNTNLIMLHLVRAGIPEAEIKKKK
ncbi:hypothetical protein CWB96_00295 [Pseudoalteromonas citrea]|uniref:Uncharacterized protein n=1 Tax=Pseudoalteromonas citrea TaxID=43655 RepID=A0A5S3XX96_9GAMM|nr:hypothetical protein [Pseudoalteromonas citrea]TMP46306.1 hypothetical protein CWB97_02290 [Pseudoalteromonas citrea]TMP63082.1 hypothetical protein CWB96_00295 [Pseudoalteromonas citrea]